MYQRMLDSISPRQEEYSAAARKYIEMAYFSSNTIVILARSLSFFCAKILSTLRQRGKE
jgi:hypothetical protein